jgi:hypothetical protein
MKLPMLLLMILFISQSALGAPSGKAWLVSVRETQGMHGAEPRTYFLEQDSKTAEKYIYRVRQGDRELLSKTVGKRIYQRTRAGLMDIILKNEALGKKNCVSLYEIELSGPSQKTQVCAGDLKGFYAAKNLLTELETRK